MTISRKLLSCAAAAWLAVSAPSFAQDFSVTDEFTAYVQRTCGQLAAVGAANRTGTQEDLFRRCNGALNAPTTSTGGLTSQGDILDQYLGIQNAVPQSDGLNNTTRANQFTSARLSVITSQLRGGPNVANLMPLQPYQIASTGDDIPVAKGVSRRGKWDGFVNLGAFTTDQDTTNDEIGYDLDGFWVSGGVDYNIDDTAIIGAAISVVDSSSDIDEIGGLSSGGDTDSTSWTVSAYGSVLVTESLELNGLFSYGQTDFDSSRVISIVDRNGGGINTIEDGNFATVNRVANSSTDADRVEVAVGASYGHYFDNGLSITPTARLSYYSSKIDEFSETDSDGLDLTFEDQEVQSAQFAIGATIAKPISQNWGVLMPYARGEVIIEMLDNPQSITARYNAALDQSDNFVIRTSSADATVFDIAAGATAQWSNGVSAFGEISTIAGHDDVSHVAVTLGIRKAF